MHAVTNTLQSAAHAPVLGQLRLWGGQTTRLKDQSHLFWRFMPFENLYLVISGALKAYNVDTQGHERIRGFHFPGDLVGLDGIATGRHHCNAMALDGALVQHVPFTQLTNLMTRGSHTSAELFRWISGEILAASQLASDYPAEQRVARFLLEMARKAPDPVWPNRVHLIMSRYDIGNYLRMATETVSRNLTRLSREGLITARGRDIDLLDMDALRRLAEPVPHSQGRDEPRP